MSAPELTDIRAPINLDNLSKYLANVSSSSPQTHIGSVAEIPRVFTTAKQFTFGQSNPTYFFEDSNGRKFVLRRKPSPNAKLISKSAHAVEREFFILNGINTLNKDSDLKVPVPRVHLLCEDEGVIGYVFYIMDYVNGIQIKNPEIPGASFEERDEYWKSIISTIAAIHSLDCEKLIKLLPPQHFPQFQNIDKLKSSSYFQRQIKTLSGIHKLQSKHVDPIPHFDKITSWILKHAPKDPAKLTLIHGDLKIDNLLFDPKTKKVCGVLDWELCTIGHPLFDLSNFLQPFEFPQALNSMMVKQTEMGKENPESQEFLYRQLRNYSKYVTWDPNDPSNDPTKLWILGHVFGLLRLCVISQGIAMRVKMGNASSANAAAFAGMYPVLADMAVEYIDAKK
ncbi:hypothetical protein KGF57_004376 [Candida theae]|uniref:Protein kinase domain-containing protein n=1 Tax=Candida theae TaxID=1198502 RepID=A0AAD5BC64_9ASCO|nr:uncharacterized protein KGF57_004376 [Candida theae]KAI5950209.1 hypothetical protein KGF57_004376 [Candida theae]